MSEHGATVSATTTSSGVGAEVRPIPGETGIWVFALLDGLVFTEMFCIFAWYKAQNRDLFQLSQQTWINPIYGLVYTLLLLTSSWCIVMAVSAVRRRRYDIANRLVLWGLVFGTAFVLIKLIEYGEKIYTGITPITNEYFMFYFVMTGIHLVHVAVGLSVLAYMRSQIAFSVFSVDLQQSTRMRSVTTCGIYWHFVDLLWIVLFAMFYLRS
ncbi:cytochrome c oxidase subunit 3 [Mycobacterium deserti]|uniref:Probable cytochrome c oxidase subunit 3 n=1 Tax=Mycobacterium deserti TaxID=2978347 RepID=A0ABT2M4J2_9MYCO|nr:cytochrome c oxidase subunit 3 [Mycobacterium deserti]MCT7657184.1 cytochrome c oxidase subunit 3 [Mycobacterium deserti]